MKYTTAEDRTFLRKVFANNSHVKKLLAERTMLRRALSKIAAVNEGAADLDVLKMTQIALDALEAE